MLGRVSFQSGGRDLACAFTTSAMCAYEEKHDQAFLSLVEKFDGQGLTSLRVSFLRELFGFSVKACNPDFSDEEVARIADEIGPQKVIELIGECIRSAFPEGDGGAKKPKPGQKGQSKK